MQDRARHYGPVDVSLWLQASGHIGGDMVGAFPVEGNTVGIFGLDVSGHGVASAMIAARVAGILSAASPDQNIALTRRPDGGYRALSPDLVAARLNRMILSEIRSDRYFTLALGFLDTGTGAMSAGAGRASSSAGPAGRRAGGIHGVGRPAGRADRRGGV